MKYLHAIWDALVTLFEWVLGLLLCIAVLWVFQFLKHDLGFTHLFFVPL